tara:strand:- start:1031 stop:1690 length:660 start_codon:yes stop_codon:yes gene_type:complete
MKLSVNVPTELNELTLGQYQKFLKVQKDNGDGIFVAQKMIEIFCGIDLKDTFKIKITDINEIVGILNDILDIKPDLINKFTLDNVEYGFIPILEDISLGEYIDIETHLQSWDDMHKAMSVLYRPIAQSHKDKYNIIEYEALETNVMKDMPLDVCFSSVVFFYNLGIELSSNMMDYLTDQEMNNLSTDQVNSMKDGGGILQFTNSLKDVLQNSKISLNKN